jgi:hypothetical protein
MGMTLAEAKADRDGLKSAVKAHKAECPQCGSTARGRARPAPCDDGRALAARAAAAGRLVKGWFAPGPDQGTLV